MTLLKVGGGLLKKILTEKQNGEILMDTAQPLEKLRGSFP